MTATLDSVTTEDETHSQVAEPPADTEQRKCPWPLEDGLCGTLLPPGSHHSRIYCDEHRESARRGKGAPSTVRKDKRPPSVNINIGAPKKAPAKSKPLTDQERVEAAASSYLALLAGVLIAVGDESCAETLTKGAPQIAKALADLSKYHPQIVKVLAPLEATGEGAAWIALAIAVFPVVVGILAHHKLLDAKRASLLGSMSISAEMFAKSVAEEASSEPDAETVPAAA